MKNSNNSIGAIYDKFPFGRFIINPDGILLETDGKLIREGEFKRYLQKYFPLPIVAKWDITNKCNINCYHCFADNSKTIDHLPFKDIKIILEEMKNAGTVMIIWTGGEPFVRKDFSDVLLYAKRLRIASHIITNGTHCSEDIFDTLQQVKPRRIDISLLSPNRDQHDQLAGRQGSYEKVLRFIENCKKRDLNVTVNLTLTKKNSNTYQNFRSFCKKNRIRGRTSIMVHPEYLPEDIENTKYHQYQIDTEQYAQLTSNAIVNNPDLKWSRSCYGGKHVYHLDTQGNLIVCVRNRKIIGNILQRGFSELFYSKEHRNAIRNSFNRPKQCNTCPALNYCLFCPADYMNLGGTRNSIPENFCEKTLLTFHLVKKRQLTLSHVN